MTRPLVLLLLAASCLTGGIAWWAAPAAGGPKAWVPAARAIDGGGAGVLGAEACRACHQDAHDRWSESSHANTFQPVTEDNLPSDVLAGKTVAHPPGQSRFRAHGAGWQVETQGRRGKPTWFDLTHVVGRMRVRMYLATMPDGRLQVLPSMLEEPTGRWFDYTALLFGGPGADPDLAPIVHPQDGSFWTGPVRAWDAKCARCHTSGHQLVAPPPGQTGLRGRQRRLGVDCEMCHGPAADHVRHHRDKQPGADPIVRFRSLARSRQISFCMRCHMESEIDDPDFRVGEDIFEHVTPTLLLSPDRIDPYGRVLELIYDGVPFSLSRCATEGGLTCVSCHDPHGSGERAQLARPADDDTLCTRCHEKIGEDVETHAHHPLDSAGARCVSCHMPFLRIERGHGIVADHSISIPRFGLTGDRVAQNACVGCHGGDAWAPPDVRTLDPAALRDAHAEWWPNARAPEAWMQALAAARRGAKDAAPGLAAVAGDPTAPRVVRASATRLLARYGGDGVLALMLRTADGDSLVRRAAFTALASARGSAVNRLLRRGLLDPVPGVRAAAARAALEGFTRVQQDRPLLEALIPVLRAYAEADPGQEQRWFDLGAAQQLLGDTAGAILAYERYLMLYPDATLVRTQLERMRK